MSEIRRFVRNPPVIKAMRFDESSERDAIEWVRSVLGENVSYVLERNDGPPSLLRISRSTGYLRNPITLTWGDYLVLRGDVFSVLTPEELDRDYQELYENDDVASTPETAHEE